jgi:hypothetical protein
MRVSKTRLLIGAATIAFAASLISAAGQTDGPLPGGPVNPDPGTSIPPEPKSFDSPFNGTRDAYGQEGQDFAKLQQAYDDLMDDTAYLAWAKKCSDFDTYERMKKLVARDQEEFDRLLGQYVLTWSQRMYGTKTPPKKNFNEQDVRSDWWPEDNKKVMEALAKNYKPRKPGRDCEGADDGTLKRDRGGADPLKDLLGHVTIGVGIGGGGGHHHHDDDRPRDDRPRD